MLCGKNEPTDELLKMFTIVMSKDVFQNSQLENVRERWIGQD